MKKCIVCGNEKHVSHFNYHAVNRADRETCKACLKSAWDSKKAAYKEQKKPRYGSKDSVTVKWLNRHKPDGFHIDHIIPLRGTENGVHVVSGLSVLCNLQYLPAFDNGQKGHKFDRELAERMTLLSARVAAKEATKK